MENNNKKKFKFSDKTKLLLLSFLIAFGLWSSVAAGSLPVRLSEQVEILQVNGQANWYYEVTPAVVEVTYEVPLIGNKEPPVVFVRLDQAKWGDQELTLQTFAPTSGRLISINPSKVKVHVEPIVSKLMSVNLLNMKVEPGQVIVTGPETAVAKVADIKTESPVSGAEVMQLKAIAVDKSGNLVENVKISPDLLTVTIQQAKDIVTMQVAVLPQFDVPPNVFLKSYSVRPRVVTVQGTASALESVAFIETSRVTVGAGSGSAKASLELPEGVELLETEDQWVTVSYSAERMLASEFILEGGVYRFLCPESVQLTASDIVVTATGVEYPSTCVFLGKGGNY